MTTRLTLFRQGVGWLIVLAPFFFLTYGQVNQFTAGRSDVGSVVFCWEQNIPFLPLTILPYWSLDLLYGLSLFVCTSRHEQRRLVCQLLLASLIACAGFLLFPLQFTFTRPDVTGFTGWLFAQLEHVDLPYNQSPSLHIILSWLLWRHFSRHLPDRWQSLNTGWFFLIAISVLTTWQHHFIDVLTGFAVGLFIDWLIPEKGNWHGQLATEKKRQLSLRYLSAMLVALCATLITPWFWWPTLALFIVTLAYGVAGVNALQKDEKGRIAPAAWWLLLPWRAGMWLSMRLYARILPPISPVREGVSISIYPRTLPVQQAVLDLTSEFPRSRSTGGKTYCCVPMLDLVIPDITLLHRAVTELEQLRANHGSVLVHCALGLSRSALVTAAWLIYRNPQLEPSAAIAMIQQARPEVVFTPASRELLQRWKTEKIN
ncbi:phosphatase PAP2/dual specificity phosphatase family protein [Pseudocitrobacter vendiensis]|uniref:Phosphatase PAP2/dual specificity phosphatase family protein n=1 Tax=Pseudocitrobacter vendiensis TaxID=2488306 RepID=A0ABN8TBX5_9ENTR|nr:phosphatase PAP2/dual specificity phosphatase family protein [Pseudocitrobacter vendiensis]CAH6636719.1 Phosphatase PAP2/dual specificity phosphatase family protein [Pseudocitrobacter vendiensis]